MTTEPHMVASLVLRYQINTFRNSFDNMSEHGIMSIVMNLFLNLKFRNKVDTIFFRFRNKVDTKYSKSSNKNKKSYLMKIENLNNKSE